MKILIKTLPLISGNNGGILQALALQQAVNRLGHVGITDTPTKYRVSWRSPIRFALDLFRAKGIRGVFEPISRNKMLTRCTSFIISNLSTVDLFQDRKVPSRKALGDWDLFLVGSDQVWRSEYCKVEDYFLEFLGSDPRPRVSYAASFGVNPKFEYTSQQLKIAETCLKEFRAISVRESSGVQILRDEFNLSGVQVLDPTLLWPAEFYDTYISSECKVDSTGAILALLLDETSATERLVENYSHELGKRVIKLYPNRPENLFEFFGNPDRYMLPSPSEWLLAIKNAKLVLTDSFHATVFCITYKVDFLVVPNESRGMDRLISLLEDLGLRERILDRGFDRAICSSKIDWLSVDKNLKPKRDQSWKFLAQALGQPDGN